jgi:signal peptidase II
VALIWAGALGNLLDSMFYGLIFDKGMQWQDAWVNGKIIKDYVDYEGVAQFTSFGKGYAPMFMGHVVDMLYFPLFKIPLPNGGQFEFFNAIFNIADAAISVGVLTIIFFQKKLYRSTETELVPSKETTAPVTDDTQVL